MATPNKLTKQQIATQANLPIGRVKYYIKHFPEYFEEIIEKGRKYPVYDALAVTIVTFIAERISTLSHPEIRAALNESGYHPIIEMIERVATMDGDDESNVVTTAITTLQDERTLTNAQSVITALNRMNDEYAAIIQKQEAQIQDRDQTIEELTTELEQLKSDQSTDKERIEALEQQLADKQPQKPFWERFTRRNDPD